MHTPVRKDTFYLEETRSNKSRSRTLSSLKDMALKKLLGETEQGFMKKFLMSPSSPKKYSKFVNYVLKILRTISTLFSEIFSGTVCQKFQQVPLCSIFPISCSAIFCSGWNLTVLEWRNFLPPVIFFST